MAQDNFMDRHIGPNESSIKEMLSTIGVSTLDELISQVVPSDIRLSKNLPLAEGMTEYEFANHIRTLAAKNKPLRTLIGMGYYGTSTPAAIIRNVFENPAWYTSYTPYQAEISQGRLEALLNFQTMVMSMTGMELCNCSLLDEATSAAEAMNMMHACRSREAVKAERNVLFVDQNIFPQTMDLLLTRSEPLGIELAVDNYDEYEFTGREFGAIVQYPAADGAVRSYKSFAATCHDRGMMITAAVDLLSLALLESPATWGADIVVGSTQRFGVPMGYGGPHAGYLATREEFKRNMPGRIIGVSIDRLGNHALRMALQTREQHIKREKATSNICTAQALLATMAGMFAVYHGPKGIRRIALNAHCAAAATAAALTKMGYKLTNDCFFDTIEVAANADHVMEVAQQNGLNLFYPDDDTVRMSFDEVSSLSEVNTIIEIFAEVASRQAVPYTAADFNAKFGGENVTGGCEICKSVARKDAFLQEPVFNSYHSETELMRYIKKLERRDISLANSMIPLGSCTMKLNSAASMMPISLAEMGNVHPFVPIYQAEGYLELIEELNKDLSIITGFDRMSFQPNSGANGEYSGLMVIRAYHMHRGQGHRNVVLIPASAHGTNPASAAMAGMKIVVTKCDENGNIDLQDWKEKAAQHAANLSCCMITYPSTHGIFESQIRELVDTVHAHGGQVYYDGANMNAVVGLSSPGYIGADVCHLNLHKTFAIPHGGGGPGVGAIGVAKHLSQFLPSHTMISVGGAEGITAVAAAPFGSASVLPITYAYIKMLGVKGLRRASEIAILNANYMATVLSKDFRVFYTGQTGRVGHEMILDFQRYRLDYGIECGDIARRLMDYGFHAPTLSFPVHDTLMIEPTESESKAELDRFIEALVSIKAECEDIRIGKADKEDNVLRMAPHTAHELIGDVWAHPYSRQTAAYPLAWINENKFFPYVSKIDGGYGDRNLITCNCENSLL